MRKIDPVLRKRIEEGNLYILRTRNRDVPLNVSYTSEGLLLTVNKHNKLICYKDAIPVIERRDNKKFVVPKALSKGGLAPNPFVKIEKFIPKDHLNRDGTINRKLQGFEFRWVDKGLKLLLDFNNPKDPAREVYKSS